MSFDIVLPTVISLVTVVIVLLYQKFESRMESLFEEKEFQIRDVVLLVVAMGVMVTIIVFVPQQAIQVLFLAAYSFVLFLFAYTAAEKWYLAVVPPAIFIALYLYFWNIWLLNTFAIIFAVSISIYLGGLFSWRTVLAFAGLITVMDVIQVFGTGFMGEAADKAITLRLPVLIQVPTFPRAGGIGLGLGDIFLGGLLSIQAMRKYGRKAGVVSAMFLGFAFFIFEILLFYYEFARFFPATLVVVAGWLLGLGLYRLAGREKGS